MTGDPDAAHGPGICGDCPECEMAAMRAMEARRAQISVAPATSPASGIVRATSAALAVLDVRCGTCGRPVRRPGCCAECAKAEAEERRRVAVIERARALVPAAYRWANLAYDGELERAVGKERLEPVRRWISDRHSVPFLLVRGVTHSYKSTVAGACVAHEVFAGRPAYFVLAADLAPPSPHAPREQVNRYHLALDRIWSLGALVAIDDVAKVLGGAAGDSGIAAWRRGDFCAAIHHRAQARARTIVTTTLRNRSGMKCAACDGRREAYESNRLVECRPCRGSGVDAHPGILDLFGEDILARFTDARSSLMLRLERKGVER